MGWKDSIQPKHQDLCGPEDSQGRCLLLRIPEMITRPQTACPEQFIAQAVLRSLSPTCSEALENWNPVQDVQEGENRGEGTSREEQVQELEQLKGSLSSWVPSDPANSGSCSSSSLVGMSPACLPRGEGPLPEQVSVSVPGNGWFTGFSYTGSAGSFREGGVLSDGQAWGWEVCPGTVTSKLQSEPPGVTPLPHSRSPLLLC